MFWDRACGGVCRKKVEASSPFQKSKKRAEKLQ